MLHIYNAPEEDYCAVNRLINWYEVFCRFTGFKWPPLSQLCACANCVTTCKMDASESRSYRISNQSCLHCVETLWSRNGRQRSKGAAQSVRYAGRRLPLAEAWRTIFARSIVRRTYDELFASNLGTQRGFIWNLCSLYRGTRGSSSLVLFNNS